LSALPTAENPARTARCPLLVLAAALAAGIAVDRVWPLPAEAWWLASVACAALLVAGLQARETRQRSRLVTAIVLAAMAAVGAALHHDRWNSFDSDEIGRMVGRDIRPIVLEAVATSTPEWIPAPPATALSAIPEKDKTRLTLSIAAVRDGQSWRSASGQATLEVDGRLADVMPGDRLRVYAAGTRPQPPVNPGEFDFAAFERSRRTLCRLWGETPESVAVIGRGSPWNPSRWLGAVRSRGASLLARSIQPGRAPLASAVLLGLREQLDPQRNEDFLVTGTIHVLSISGLHIGILAAGFWLLLRTGLMAERPLLVAAMAITILYAFLTGLEPPVVRATVLVVTMCLARLIGREAFGFNTLALAGIVVLAYHPASLFLAGPQLSFLAVAVMILAAPLLMPRPITDPLDRLIASARSWPERAVRYAASVLWRMWLTGALIWVAALPLVWLRYQLISPGALVLNLLVWVPIAIALYAGFLVLLVGPFVSPVAVAAGRMCDWNLQLIETTIAWGRTIPGSYFWFPAPPSWWVAVFYVGLAGLAVTSQRRSMKLWWIALPAVWLLVAFLLATPAGKARTEPSLGHEVWPRSESVAGEISRSAADAPPALICTFLSVGHGVSCLVELPSGEALLYDCGKLGSPQGAARSTASLLWSRGRWHLDSVILSHADVDHYNGIPELLERISVGTVYVSPVMFELPEPALDELAQALDSRGVAVQRLHGGQRLSAAPDVRLEVLHPPRRGVIGSDNANSLVLLVEYADRRVLLTGDLESPGLDDLLAEEPLDCDVILAPHHGSRRSDPTGFSLWSRPEYVIVSGSLGFGDERQAREVAESYAARGANVLHTATAGCIEVKLSAGGVEVRTMRDAKHVH
jgi:competence protein ComEC